MDQTMSFEDREQAREFYAANMARIMAVPRGWGIDKYRYPFLDKLSPIEKIAFNECVSSGLVMYPEFPVGKYFVDLGNPRVKVGLELDGLEFHLDMHKDAVRDAELWAEHGWRIFRSTGGRCMVAKPRPDELDKRKMREWLHATVDGLIYAIHRVYFCDIDDSVLIPLDEMCRNELDRSRIISDFPIVAEKQVAAKTA